MTREVFETSFVHVGMVTDALEDLLLDDGVSVYYTAQPAGALYADGRIAGVMLGGKYGLQAVLAPVVVDCSPMAPTAKMAGATFASRRADGLNTVTYSILCKDDLPALERYAICPEVVQDAQVITRGFYAELERTLPFDPGNPLLVAQISAQLRQDLLSIGTWSRQTLPELDIVRGGDVFLPGPFWRLDSVAANQANAAAGNTGAGAPGATAADCARLLAQGIPNLYVLSQCADLDDRPASAMHRGYHRAIYQAAELGRILTQAGHPEASEYEVRTGSAVSDAPSPVGSQTLSVRDGAFQETGVWEIQVSLPEFPMVAETEVLVIGAGSSGAPAAAAASSGGAKVILVEKHGDIGGTNTIGGVTTPWFGYRPPYFQRLQKRLRATKRESSVPHALALSEWLAESGVNQLPSVAVTGVYHDDEHVGAVVGLGPYGPFVIAADILIDATGDGDIAAWAGVPYSYGTERDHVTMWCSFGKFTDKRPSVSRKYRSIIDVRSIRDITRGMTIGRRQIGMFGEAEYPQYYLTARESRHITGRTRLTFLDGMSERRFDDTVAVHRSNFDIKGLASSDLVMIGFMDHEKYRCYQTYVPYATMVPEKLTNVLVTGKAYSASHDVVGLARQVADVMCQGAAAGYAAALAAGNGRRVDQLDVPTLQSTLIAEGLLAEPDITEQVPDAIQTLDAFITTGDFKHLGRLALVGESAVDTIRRRIDQTDGLVRRCLARLLCYYGDTSATDFLIEDLAHELEQDLLPPEFAEIGNMPNHGYAPEAIHSINALALVNEKRLISILAPIPARIHLPKDDTDAQFNYVHAIGYAAERMTDGEFVPILLELLDNPDIGNRTLSLDDDPRKTADFVGDRYAYLEVCIARALARCGEARGYEVLIRYLADMRSFLAHSALDELKDMTGADLWFDQDAWKTWLDQNRDALEQKPLTRRFD